MDVDSSTSATTRIATAQNAAAKAEREAAERVTNAQKEIRDANHEAEVQLDHLRDQYEKRAEVERARGDDYIESVRNRSYENLADVRHRAETEQNRYTRESAQNLHETQKYFERAQHEEETRGEANVKDLARKNFTAYEYERKRGIDELDELKSNYANQKKALHAEQEMTREALQKHSKEMRQADEEKTREAIENSHDHYQSAYEGAVKQMKNAVDDVNWRASRDIASLKADTAQKLNSYSSQKSDPFYRMVNLDAEIRENSDQFVLTARIPPHERDRININLNGNQITVSGKRRSDEILDLEPGHRQRTSSFQSFSESFPLNWPVNPKNMTREWDGDTLIVRIPKRATYEAPRPQKEVFPAVAERPKFPKNLPTEDALTQKVTAAEAEPEDQTTPPSQRKKAGSTIS